MIQWTRQLRKPFSSQTQGMTMTILPHGITPTNIKSQKRVKSKVYQPLVTPTARNPLNQVPLPPQRANKCLCPQEQGSPKSNKGHALQKPLSLQGIPRASVCEPCRKTWHGVRLAGSFRGPTQANLICGGTQGRRGRWRRYKRG